MLQARKEKILKECMCLALTVLASIMSGLTLHIFVYSNGFAPMGVDGIATMLQKITGLNAGLFSFLINAPLLVIAWLFLNKRYATYTIVYIGLASLSVYVLDMVDFYQYTAEYERFVAAIFSGLLLGIRTGIMLRIGFSTGGIDIISALVQKKRSHVNIERIISVFCYSIIGISFFVYDYDLGSVMLSITQMFVFEKGVSLLLSDNRDAVAFHIVTKHPEQLKTDITEQLKHGATVMQSYGMYTGESSSTIISIVNRRQIPEFLGILKNYPDAFVYYTEIKGVKGNFRWKKDDAVQ